MGKGYATLVHVLPSALWMFLGSHFMAMGVVLSRVVEDGLQIARWTRPFALRVRCVARPARHIRRVADKARPQHLHRETYFTRSCRHGWLWAKGQRNRHGSTHLSGAWPRVAWVHIAPTVCPWPSSTPLDGRVADGGAGTQVVSTEEKVEVLAAKKRKVCAGE